MNDGPDHVMISRWFDAPPTAVWAAFTDPARLAQWYGPDGVTVAPDSVSVEARVGGAWSLTMLMGERQMPLTGTIAEVREPELLVVTDTLPDGTVVTMTVALAAEDGGTRLELRQGPFPTSGVGGAEGAWGQALDKLDRLVAR